MSESKPGPPETDPIILPVLLPAEWSKNLGTVSHPQTSGAPMTGLLPWGVDEPEFILRGNKLRCTKCGTDSSSRAKYVRHFLRRHHP